MEPYYRLTYINGKGDEIVADISDYIDDMTDTDKSGVLMAALEIVQKTAQSKG